MRLQCYGYLGRYQVHDVLYYHSYHSGMKFEPTVRKELRVALFAWQVSARLLAV